MLVHFIGIGGIGISALAQYYLDQGDRVTGSDLAKSATIELLRKKGARIKIGQHKSSNLKEQVDLVIYSPAVQRDNPELKKARTVKEKNKQLKILSYPQALGTLTRKYFTIAVSGTHGKSTTTAMIALILVKAGLDPTVIIGTKLKEFNWSNFRAGRGQYLIIEADEWQASFLNYQPRIIVLTNIEREHLDYYKDINHILDTYQQYIAALGTGDILIFNGEDKNIRKVLAREQEIQSLDFSSLKTKEKLKKNLRIPGQHNLMNALAALATAQTLKIPLEKILKALSQYRGAWRRFQEKEISLAGKKIKLISDYGHHPSEIRATLSAAREKYPDKKIVLLFQPHQYQRTYYLFKDFIATFKNAHQQGHLDQLVITDVYDVAGREKKGLKKKVDSSDLVKGINKSWAGYLRKNKLKHYLKNNSDKGTIMLVMGAGDIYEIVE